MFSGAIEPLSVKAAEADVGILEICRRTNAQAALSPVVAAGDENVEVGSVGASVGPAEERSPVRVVSAQAP
jgi:hypothetical protein